MAFDLNFIFWPGLAIAFGIPTLIFIPRENYKKFLLFGFVLGGFIDVFTIIILGNFLGEFTYIAGPLEAFGIPVFVPIAFTFVWMLFFFFLPVRVEFLIPYILGFSGFAVMLGFIEQNLGFFKFNHGDTRGAIVTIITFILWFAGSALVYRSYDNKLPE
ncbi:hypothetical protein [Desulfosporosinus youngiae]|uniref:Uncharacterized protein n=1 Tax=Desulfosporosinus youngiae DSM 17734 TaxID=768710 RepID=H5Y0Q7_9FIRM|nr:hypothetical protein [Desulfosporosinus youngiae]EHQ92313.1 hypothetical protein DesyoDRAFT_5386 [Desulfosporosinus youngiae DSM 17734]